MEDYYLDSYYEDQFDYEDHHGLDWNEENDHQDDYDDYDPGDMDGDFDSGMASAGHGMDEDYGYYGDYDY